MIITQESLFEYQMRKLFKKFRNDYGLEDLTAEQLQEAIWNSHSREFARAVSELCSDFSGDELFERFEEKE